MISAAYKQEQQRMHREIPEYGVASVHFAPIVTNIVNSAEVDELLDYGCGKGRLAGALKPQKALAVYGYDPGIEGLDSSPDPTEMVVCIDVLEHVEPDHIDDVLDDLKRVTMRLGFFSIHTGPAIKVLSDGRNAHLIQEDYTWWMPKLWDRFHVHSMQHASNGFYVVVQKWP